LIGFSLVLHHFVVQLGFVGHRRRHAGFGFVQIFLQLAQVLVDHLFRIFRPIQHRVQVRAH